MCFLKWNDSMKIGVVEIDIQHRTLLDIINMLAEIVKDDNITSPYDKTPVRILKEFDRFIKYHFATEEEMFEANNYIDEHHIKAHNEILEKLKKLKRLKCSNKLCLEKVLKLSKELYLGHTLTLDKQFGEYMQVLEEKRISDAKKKLV